MTIKYLESWIFLVIIISAFLTFRHQTRTSLSTAISTNPLPYHVKSDQSDQSCIMCYDCGTHSLLHSMRLCRGCVLSQCGSGGGACLSQTTLFTSSRLHSRQTLLFLDCENERDEWGSVGIGWMSRSHTRRGTRKKLTATSTPWVQPVYLESVACLIRRIKSVSFYNGPCPLTDVTGMTCPNWYFYPTHTNDRPFYLSLQNLPS